MAIKTYFNGKSVILPGVYSRVVGGFNNTPQDFSYGNVLIIDKDATSLYGGGAGIAGEHATGQDSVYEFDNVRDFRAFVGGGKQWDLAEPLFRPFGSQTSGVSKLYYARALTTVAASVSLAFTNDTVGIDTLHEGLVGNGVEVTSVLKTGFAVTVEAGIVDTAKQRIKFWKGSFKGLASDGLPYDGISSANSTPELILTSDEFSTFEEFEAWTLKSADFIDNFKLANTGLSGAVVVGDIATLSGNNLFAGGTSAYAAARVDEILTAVTDLDYTFVLGQDSGASVESTDNFTILTHLEQEAKFEKFLVVGGGATATDFAANSTTAATNYNSDRVILVHGSVNVADRSSGSGTREKDSLHKAAYVLGRMAGLEPQTPITYKGIGISSEVHKLTNSEKIKSLEAGVVVTEYNSNIGANIIVLGVNTLQESDSVINADGSSHLVSVKRIAAQLNKELQLNLEKDLLGNQVAGPNRATLTEGVIREYVKSYLNQNTATTTQDNLILSFQDIVVSIKGTSYSVNYSFVGNTEINKIFTTGVMIEG